MQNDEKPDKVRTSEKTFDIVDAIIKLDPTTLTDISSYLDISPSTVYRHLNTLIERGYIEKRGDKFSIGSQFLTLGGIVRGQKQEYKWAEDYVQKLAEETNERAQFEIEENGERVFLFRRVGNNIIREKSLVGKRGAIHASAAGKAILAEYPNEKIYKIIERHGLPAVTEHTITDTETLIDEITDIRERGFATNFEESRTGYNAVGASVIGVNNIVVGALSVSAPAYRLDEESINNKTADTVLDVMQEYELYIEFNARR